MISSISSSTGPQYCDWHRAGVANSAATGAPVPITDASDTVCRGQAGRRVQIGLTPSGSVTVGDAARGAGWPAIGAAGAAFTWIENGTASPPGLTPTAPPPAAPGTRAGA